VRSDQQNATRNLKNFLSRSREVRQKQRKVRWTFLPPNGRRRFFCAPAGITGVREFIFRREKGE
jgi:hypothetical protein